MENLGEKIRKLREAKKLPLRTVASYLDLDQAILSKIERGQRNASRAQVLMLAKYFKVKENELLISWLSDKLVRELSDESFGLEALKLAEEKVEYIAFNKINRKNLLNKIILALKKFDVIKRAYIFGSFSRGDDNHKSDIDILIDVPKNKTFTLFDIAEIQENLQKLITRKVDVVMLSALRPEVRERIKPDMKLIYEA